MSTDRDVTAIVRSWLDEGATRLPDRVLDNVLDSVPSTAQRRGFWPARRSLPMNGSLKVLLAGAAVIAAVAVGFALLPRSNPDVGPGATATATASPSLSSTPGPQPSPTGPTSLHRSAPDLLRPGAYVIDQLFDHRITFQLPANWTGLGQGPGNALIIKTKDAKAFGTGPNTVLLGIYAVDGVLADPCKDVQPAEPRPTTVDGFIAALSTAVGIQAGPVTDTTLGGLPAKVFDLRNTINMDNCKTKPFDQWTFKNGPASSGNGTSSGPGDHQRIWIVDVGGTILLVNADLSDDSYPGDSAELIDIVNSLTFE